MIVKLRAAEIKLLPSRLAGAVRHAKQNKHSCWLCLDLKQKTGVRLRYGQTVHPGSLVLVHVALCAEKYTCWCAWVILDKLFTRAALCAAVQEEQVELW